MNQTFFENDNIEMVDKSLTPTELWWGEQVDQDEYTDITPELPTVTQNQPEPVIVSQPIQDDIQLQPPENETDN